MTTEKPITMEELLKDYKKDKTTLGILKDEQESRMTTGKGILGTSGKSKEELDEEIYLLGKRIKIIDDAMASLPELQRRIIQRRIIDRESSAVVCGELHMSESSTRQLKRKALAALERMMPRH